MRIPVGVVVARRKAASQWIDFTWTPVAVLHGVPEAAPWTVLRQEGEAGETTTFYAGSAEIELYRSETTYYRDNLRAGAPLLWVVLAPTEGEPPYRLVTVTADPAEGEGFTESAANLVETVPMPGTIARDRCGVRRRAPCRAAVLQAQARPPGHRVAGAPRLWRSR